MAPKTKRSRSKFDSTRFGNQKAEDRYNDALNSRRLIPERSFLNPGGQVANLIEQRVWENYCYFSAVAVVSVVREFYANLPDIVDGFVFVRGKQVMFSPEIINIFCMTQPTGMCTYTNAKPSDAELDEIIAFLTNGTGHWKERNGKKLNFSSTHLTAESKAWHYFISARLLPSGHISEVTKDRAILNHCIQTLRPVDVGQIVYQTAFNSARANTTAGFGFPGLIYALCQQSGITADSREEQIHFLQPISRSLIMTYHKVRGPEEETSSRRPPSQIPFTAGASTSADPEPTNSELMTRIEEIQEDLHELQRRQHSEERRRAHHEAYLKAQSDFWITQYPNYPPYTTYVPPSDPLDDDSHWPDL